MNTITYKKRITQTQEKHIAVSENYKNDNVGQKWRKEGRSSLQKSKHCNG